MQDNIDICVRQDADIIRACVSIECQVLLSSVLNERIQRHPDDMSISNVRHFSSNRQGTDSVGKASLVFQSVNESCRA
jgi:hypothetical protein